MTIAYLFVLLFSPRVEAITPKTALIAGTASDSPPPISPNLPRSEVFSPNDVKAYITAQAAAFGVNPRIADWIVQHESQYGQNMRGDDGQSRGYWMISSVYHPEVSTACADNLKCSTEWSLNWILKGNVNQWSTMKFCRKWYEDCPF